MKGAPLPSGSRAPHTQHRGLTQGARTRGRGLGPSHHLPTSLSPCEFLRCPILKQRKQQTSRVPFGVTDMSDVEVMPAGGVLGPVRRGQEPQEPADVARDCPFTPLSTRMLVHTRRLGVSCVRPHVAYLASEISPLLTRRPFLPMSLALGTGRSGFGFHFCRLSPHLAVT